MTAVAAAERESTPLRDDRTLRDARAEYFRANAFGDDGGYAAKWVDFKVGPIPFPFPNTRERVRAVRYHDLHHVLTGYRTDFLGELEISAWEIGSGCADMWAAWVLNLGGMAAGFCLAPTRTFRAFVRGRRSKNLYRHAFGDALLDRRVADVREELGLDREPEPARAFDVLAASFYGAVGFAVGAVSFWSALPLVPVGWLAGKVLRR